MAWTISANDVTLRPQPAGQR